MAEPNDLPIEHRFLAPEDFPACPIDKDNIAEQAFPSRMLRERADSIRRALPRSLGNFLDIGSCKGYFVLEAAASASCPLAVGIDVHEPFVGVANEVRNWLGRDNARFHCASLDAVAAEPGRFGGPFQTVLLVSTYHYLYWGSDLEPKAFGQHRTILAMLARVCRGYLVFANPLEIRDCPAIIQHAARARGAGEFNRESFLDAATEFFDVFQIGHMDRKRKRPLLLLARNLQVRREREVQSPAHAVDGVGVHEVADRS